MRRAISVGVSLALGVLVPVLAVSVPAAARPTPSVTVELAGSLTIAWQGDEDRGCAAEGLCGVSGSLQMLPTGESSVSPGPPPIELTDPNAVARVTEVSASGAPEATCADVVPVDFQLGVRHQATGGLLAVIETNPTLQLPSAGRCAGPTAGDLSALVLPARKLGSHGYDLSGQTTFGAGPFTVTVISTVRAVFSRGDLGPLGGLGSIVSTSGTNIAVGHSPPPPRLRTELQEHAEVDYRIEGATGALTTSFLAVSPPLCDPLGACGTSGEESESLGAGGTVSFFGSSLVKHRVGSQAALADLRAGRLGLTNTFSGIPLELTTTETAGEPGGTTCSDQVTQGPFTGQTVGTSRHTVELELTGGDEPDLFGGGGLDAVRTRCPGPSSADVLGTSPLAIADVPVSALGARPLSIIFQTGGSFHGSAYAGERSGSIVLSLVLEHASAGTSRIHLPSIPPRP